MRVLSWRQGLLAITLLVSGACGRVPPTHYYLLQPLGPTLAQPARDVPDVDAGVAIGVEDFEIDPPYDQDRIVFRIGADSPEIGFYAYHRWATPLSRMLPLLVADVFRNASVAAVIEPARVDRQYPLILGGRLRTLEEVDLPEGQRLRVALQLRLAAADGTPVWSRELEGEATVRADDVEEVVRAFRDVLSALLQEAGRELHRALAARRGPPAGGAVSGGGS